MNRGLGTVITFEMARSVSASDLTDGTDPVEPAPDELDIIEETVMRPTATSAWSKWLLGGIATALVVLVALVTVRLRADDEAPSATKSETPGNATTEVPPATATTSSPTNAPVTIPATIVVPTTAPVVVPPSAFPASPVVWPRPGHEVRFDDPVAVARSFAIYYAGFSDPSVGPFVAGDGRSGEVAVRSHRSAVTTVLVQRMGDDHWYVIGATAPSLDLDTPGFAGNGVVRCPGTVLVTGSVLSFEGHVDVRIDSFGPEGFRTEIGSGFGTGSGTPPAAPFRAEVDCDAALIAGPGSDNGGVVMAWDEDPFDGRLFAVAAHPVSFVP